MKFRFILIQQELYLVVWFTKCISEVTLDWCWETSLLHIQFKIFYVNSSVSLLRCVLFHWRVKMYYLVKVCIESKYKVTNKRKPNFIRFRERRFSDRILLYVIMFYNILNGLFSVEIRKLTPTSHYLSSYQIVPDAQKKICQ